MSTDIARLTDDEREDLWRAYESWTEGDFSEHMGQAVEGMMGARLAAVRALADEWERDDEESLNRFGQHLMGGAVAVCAEHLRAALEGR